VFCSGLEAIYIEGTAHCANMYPEREDDPQQLKQARSAIQTSIKILQFETET
jgi:hypothetical protein